VLKELGFDSREALQKALEEGKTALDARKTAEEKQAETLKQAQERAQALEAQAKQAVTQAEQASLALEAIGQMAGRFANPRAAMKLLDLSNVKRGDDGSYTGLKEAIEKLATDEPWTLAQPQQAKRPVAPAIGATNPEGDQSKATSDADRRARYFGNLGGGQDFFAGGGLSIGQQARTGK
jgi:hypothetical protein